jgi:hypothetical protein
MAFKEVTDLNADNTVAIGGMNRKTGKKNPSSIEGYYLGSRKVESKKAKTGFAYIHVLQTAKGNVGVWGKTDLDRKILAVSPGTMIKAEHVGMVATPNGEMYKYKVFQDADNTIEVSGQSTDGVEASEGGEEVELPRNSLSDGYDSEETELEDEESFGAEEEIDLSAVRASLDRAAANKARVQALLNKNKKA